jgi:hypothetical protein
MLELERSGLRDEMETLGHRVNRTIGAGVAITALFVVSGLFMKQSGTLWLLGVLWLFFASRLALINVASGREPLSRASCRSASVQSDSCAWLCEDRVGSTLRSCDQRRSPTPA